MATFYANEPRLSYVTTRGDFCVFANFEFSTDLSYVVDELTKVAADPASPISTEARKPQDSQLEIEDAKAAAVKAATEAESKKK